MAGKLCGCDTYPYFLRTEYPNEGLGRITYATCANCGKRREATKAEMSIPSKDGESVLLLYLEGYMVPDGCGWTNPGFKGEIDG